MLVKTVKLVIDRTVVVLIDQPDTLVPLPNTCEVLDAIKTGSVDTPHPSFCRSAIAPWEVDIICLVGELLQIVTIIQHRIILSYLKHGLNQAADWVGRITMIQADTVITAAV